MLSWWTASSVTCFSRFPTNHKDQESTKEMPSNYPIYIIDQKEWDEFKEEAYRKRVSLAEWIREACRAELKRAKRKQVKR